MAKFGEAAEYPATTILPLVGSIATAFASPAEVSHDLAVAVEAGVERAVRVVARDCEVGVAEVFALPATTILPSLWIATPLAASRR